MTKREENERELENETRVEREDREDERREREDTNGDGNVTSLEDSRDFKMTWE
jgi:hypothetical protein